MEEVKSRMSNYDKTSISEIKKPNIRNSDGPWGKKKRKGSNLLSKFLFLDRA